MQGGAPRAAVTSSSGTAVGGWYAPQSAGLLEAYRKGAPLSGEGLVQADMAAWHRRHWLEPPRLASALSARVNTNWHHLVLTLAQAGSHCYRWHRGLYKLAMAGTV